MRIVVFTVSIVIAAVGGTIAYRALFLEPSAAVVVTNTSVREMPNLWRVLGGAAMLVCGACAAFFALRRPLR
jgi:hypothetical protein